MSWADSRSTRATRPTYVPPYLRNNNGVTVTTPEQTQPYGFTGEPSYVPGYQFNPSGFGGTGQIRPNRGRGRGRGRGRSWVQPREFYNPNPTQNGNPYDIAEKFDGLQVIEDTHVDGGINFDAYEDIPVETSGSDIPPPVKLFADVDLGEVLNDNIQRCKYVKPTPVQRHAIPIAMAGRDLMACAQTGSGKTAAFCFPIISGLMRNHLSPAMNEDSGIVYPLALILSPTRELTCQIHEEAKKFSYQTGIKIVVTYGGAPIAQQVCR